ncbi:carbon monoxide dehydrogenase subunit G [Pelagibius sp.]|uniref:SRPBCC family protein n=1 Tax=Pelagibius sp. TaxID=1931238 RepID=UPI00260ADBDE|nr:carbon monoxide dehydrogenase subunit G [Pelagibius sp.]
MQMTGQYRIEASRQAVWEALNDVEVLRACIPGVEEIEKTSDTSFTAKVRAKVGPVSARFAGEVTLSDLDPPNGYTIAGEGKGGAAGFAKGGAKVRLEDDGGATLLNYDVDAQVGGKLAQIGSRLIDGTAKKLADDFFARFAETVGGPAETAAETEPAEPEAAAEPVVAAQQDADPDADPDADVGAGASVGVWVTGLLVAVLILIAIFAL